MAPGPLPWLADRPLVAERCLDGMNGPSFFQKNFARGLPFDVPMTPIVAESTGRTVKYVVGGSRETLLTLVNLGCIAIHVMNCQTGRLEEPDWLAFEPGSESGQFADAEGAGRLQRTLLDERWALRNGALISVRLLRGPTHSPRVECHPSVCHRDRVVAARRRSVRRA